MATKPTHDFGKRRPVTVAPVSTAPVKRSGHVALLLMGTLAVGGGAYALMPRQNCEPTQPGMTTPVGSAACQPRGSSSSSSHGGSGGGTSSRSSFFSGDSSSSHSSSGTSDSASGSVQRGGFGAFAHSFASHFSGGG